MGYEDDDTSHDDELYIVRKLHIAQKGYKVLASDMDQAQYRIFASYANNPRIVEAYQKNPDLNFHKFMWALIKPYADLTYRQQKDTNFAYLFGAGVAKMAWMLHHITKHEFEQIRHSKQYDHPKLAATKEVRRIYEREVPEMKDLLDEAAYLAKPECDERCRKGDRLHRSGLKHRGYVKDAIGRRMRFPDGQRLHKAFNGVDQCTEASYMKSKLVELHQERQTTGLILRITNHDEIVGDILDDEGADKVDKILNRQSFPQLRIPLTWATGVGPNWAETK
jgi:DNA polymerase I-like protein with 3'-5' exonuclease and polymerase domains